VSALDKLPEHLKSRKTAEAITAPSAIILAGVGASAAILGGLPLLVAAGVGALAYGARVAFGLPRRKKREKIEMAGLHEPWRHFVREAVDAEKRFQRAVSASSAGPLRDRLNEIGTRIDQGVHEVYRVARRGAALEGGLTTLEADQARRHLSAVLNALPSAIQPAAWAAHGAGGDIAKVCEEAGVDRNWVQTIEALQAQVGSANRLESVARDARDRLALLDARLDEAVARAVELSLRAEDVAELGGLGGDVEELVGEMESLRVALEEAGAAGRSEPVMPAPDPAPAAKKKGGGTAAAGTA